MSERDDMLSFSRWWMLIIFFLLGTGVIFTTCKFISKPVALVDIATEPNKMLYDYHYFSNQYEAIKSYQRQVALAEQTVKDKLASLPSNKSEWFYQDREEVSRLQANVTALKAALSQAVADYNARSQQVDRTILKDGNLPEHIDIAQ